MLDKLQHKHHPQWAKHVIAVLVILGASATVFGLWYTQYRGVQKDNQEDEQQKAEQARAVAPESAVKSLPEPFNAYIAEHPAWLTAQQSADAVYLTDRRQWMVIAVGSSPVDKKNPKDACELRALDAVVSNRSNWLSRTAELRDGDAVRTIRTFAAGDVSGLPVVGEWYTQDGKHVSVLYGKLLAPEAAHLKD